MSERVLINVRVRPEAKARMDALATTMDLSLSDIARMAMSRGLVLLEQDLGGSSVRTQPASR